MQMFLFLSEPIHTSIATKTKTKTKLEPKDNKNTILICL